MLKINKSQYLYIMGVASFGAILMSLFVSAHWLMILTGAVCGAGAATVLCLIFPKPWKSGADRF